jgi:hypothetical protein
MFTGPLPTVPVCIEVYAIGMKYLETCGMLEARFLSMPFVFSILDYKILNPPPREENDFHSDRQVLPYINSDAAEDDTPKIIITMRITEAEPDGEGGIKKTKRVVAQKRSRPIILDCRECMW